LFKGFYSRLYLGRALLTGDPQSGWAVPVFRREMEAKQLKERTPKNPQSMTFEMSCLWLKLANKLRVALLLDSSLCFRRRSLLQGAMDKSVSSDHFVTLWLLDF